MKTATDKELSWDDLYKILVRSSTVTLSDELKKTFHHQNSSETKIVCVQPVSIPPHSIPGSPPPMSCLSTVATTDVQSHPSQMWNAVDFTAPIASLSAGTDYKP